MSGIEDQTFWIIERPQPYPGGRSAYASFKDGSVSWGFSVHCACKFYDRESAEQMCGDECTVVAHGWFPAPELGDEGG